MNTPRNEREKLNLPYSHRLPITNRYRFGSRVLLRVDKHYHIFDWLHKFVEALLQDFNWWGVSVDVLRARRAHFRLMYLRGF